MLAVMFDCIDQMGSLPLSAQPLPWEASDDGSNGPECIRSPAGLSHATILGHPDQGPIGTVYSALGRLEGTILCDVYSQMDEARKKILRLRRATRSFAQDDEVNWSYGIAVRSRGVREPSPTFGRTSRGPRSAREKSLSPLWAGLFGGFHERFARPRNFFVRRSSGRCRRGLRRPRCCATGSRGPSAAAGCWPSTATGAAAAGRGRWSRRPRTACGRDR